MKTKEALNILYRFKKLILDLLAGNGNRSEINQYIPQVKKITYNAGTRKLMTIAPPPIIGGMILRNVDPMDMIFDAPYGLDIEICNKVIDMLDETIGILQTNPKFIETKDSDMKQNIKKHQKSINNKVFIVHGRDNELKESVARFVEKMGLEAIILHEQANAGRTIIEKFENAADVGFAIVLLTPDDVGGLTNSELQPRARQNVVFELGYFIGNLGRNHVAALIKDNVEIPSDISGVVYIGIDMQGFWKMAVAKELKACGYDIDLNKLM